MNRAAPLRYPDLGVLTGMSVPERLRALLVAASTRCRPVACSAAEPSPDGTPLAYVWAGSSTHPPAGAPYAAWVDYPRDLDAPLVRAADVVLCPDRALLDATGGRGVYVPPATGDPRARPVPPFVRRRLRRARGLPALALAHGEGDRWYWDTCDQVLDADLAGTAAGCAAAVVATGGALATALLWGAATVTDPASAAALDAVDGVHVLVAADAESRLDLARVLATDEARAARLGLAGRLLARERADLRHAAWTMLSRLGVPTQSLAGRLAPLEHHLDVLGTPEESPVRQRVRARTAALPPLAPRTEEGAG